MTDIRKLADELRALGDGSTNVADDCSTGAMYAFEKAAEMVEAALPKWTKITEDKSTWPEDGLSVLYVAFSDSVSEIGINLSWQYYTGTQYRYLTDYDYPPE